MPTWHWIEPGGAKGSELRATWARLAIEIDGKSVTRAIDSLSRGVRDSVYLPLYPFAEWLVTNWWFLLYEVEPRQLGAGEGFYGRHSLRSAGEGLRFRTFCSVQPVRPFKRTGARQICPINGSSLRSEGEPLSRCTNSVNLFFVSCEG